MVTIYERNDKRRIGWLIDFYLSGRIDATTFCDEYHACYDLEVNLDTLTPAEAKFFNELSNVAGRFSEFEEDHKNCPNAFFTEE